MTPGVPPRGRAGGVQSQVGTVLFGRVHPNGKLLQSQSHGFLIMIFSDESSTTGSAKSRSLATASLKALAPV